MKLCNGPRCFVCWPWSEPGPLISAHFRSGFIAVKCILFLNRVPNETLVCCRCTHHRWRTLSSAYVVMATSQKPHQRSKQPFNAVCPCKLNLSEKFSEFDQQMTLSCCYLFCHSLSDFTVPKAYCPNLNSSTL